MNYKKNSPKPTLFMFLFLCFSFYLLAQLHLEYLATRTEVNSWKTFKTAANTVALHGISVLSAGMINLGTQLNKIQRNLNNDELTSTHVQEPIQIPATHDSEESLIEPHKAPNTEIHLLHPEEIHKKIFKQKAFITDTSPEHATEKTDTAGKTIPQNKENSAHHENQEIPEQPLLKEELNPLDSSTFSHIDTLEDQLTSAQKYILREEATDYSDHTINVLSEEIKSLKSYAHYIETEYGNEDHKKTFQKKLLTLVNKSEQLLTAITQELTGIDQLFQPSNTVEQGIEHNKTILAQLRTQLS